MSSNALDSALVKLVREALAPELEAHRAGIRADVRRALKELHLPSPPAALSTREAAEYLGVSTRTVERMRADRRLTPSRVGRQLRYLREDLDDLLEAGK